jgi:hypothetical protein
MCMKRFIVDTIKCYIEFWNIYELMFNESLCYMLFSSCFWPYIDHFFYQGFDVTRLIQFLRYLNPTYKF